MSGSAHWLTSRIVGHVAASGLCLGAEQKCMRTVRTRLGLDTCRHWTPVWVLFKARVCSIQGPWDPPVGSPDPILGGSGSHSRGLACTSGGPRPTPEVRTIYPGVRDQPWGSRLYIQGSDALPWGSRLTVDALEYATSFGHVAASGPPMWRGRALLWTHNSCLRLGRAVVWSHTHHFYHTTKG
jgi:hypothetical protein